MPKTAGTSATPVPPTPLPTRCEQVRGFEHALPADIVGFRFPPGTVEVAATTTQGSGRFTVVTYSLCAPDNELNADPANGSGGYPLGAIFVGNWENASQFPTDGQHLATCAQQQQGNYIEQLCRMLPSLVYAMEDQIREPGPGLLVFRLQVASPPSIAVCDPAVFPGANGASGMGYPSAISPLDSIQIPLPPLTIAGTSVWGYQPLASGTGNSPYVRTPLCTQGSAASILSALKSQMPAYGWTASSHDGTRWQIANPGGLVLHLLVQPISTPSEWFLDEYYLDEGTPPIFPTPLPAGPDAQCSQVPGLEHATPLRLAGLPFPADTVAVSKTVVSGAGKLTVVDYFACAPHFQLTANPALGSGGYPLEGVFEGANWNYSSTFPFDGINQLPCDSTMTGNYVNQLCRVQGSGRYAAIEEVAEPGKGLVTFHLLIATAP